jgi:hypothetical protein
MLHRASNVGQIKKRRSSKKAVSFVYIWGLGYSLGPVSGYPMFVIIAGGVVAGYPVCASGVGHVAGAETCGDYQRENAQFDCAEDVLFGSFRFHDFKFTNWMAGDGRGLTVFLSVRGL